LKKKDMALVICGTGGHARILADILIKTDRKILGFITEDRSQIDPIFNIKILGDDSYLTNFSNQEVLLVNGIGSLPGNDLRYKFAKKMRKIGFSFASVIHLSSIIGEEVVLDEGVQLMAGTVIQNNVRIGADTIINTRASVDHDSIIGRDCHISPGVICCGGVNVSNGVHIGAGSIVIQNISVGEKSIIAAGSTIFKDVSPGEKVIQKVNQ
jgi:UDP-perosamine 4-acetyltransferase